MKVPSKEDLYKNQYHMEFLSVDGEWERLDTFTFYEFDRAVNLVIKEFLKTETHHRLIDSLTVYSAKKTLGMTQVYT